MQREHKEHRGKEQTTEVATRSAAGVQGPLSKYMISETRVCMCETQTWAGSSETATLLGGLVTSMDCLPQTSVLGVAATSSETFTERAFIASGSPSGHGCLV